MIPKIFYKKLYKEISKHYPNRFVTYSYKYSKMPDGSAECMFVLIKHNDEAYEFKSLFTSTTSPSESLFENINVSGSFDIYLEAALERLKDITNQEKIDMWKDMKPKYESEKKSTDTIIL